jgi:adenosylcobinamide-GDP ribazoletransferase
MKGLSHALSFLTILPVKGGNLGEVANSMHYFPLVGALLAGISYPFSYFLRYGLPDPLVAVMTFSCLLVLTGLHHSDGLLDIGDAFMVQGSQEKKIAVMHDQQVGIGGFSLVFFVFIITVISLSILLRTGVFFCALLSSEVAASFSLACVGFFGRPSHEGMGSVFLETVSLRSFLATALMAGIILAPFKIIGLFIMTVTVTSSYVLAKIAEIRFGGVGGDFLGASHELVRMISLLSLVVIV